MSATACHQPLSGMTAEEQKLCYASAFACYERKAYRKAARLFQALVLVNPFSVDYWKGLASAKQMAREYDAALHAWSVRALLTPEDPLNHFHAAECLMGLREWQEAQKAIAAALQLGPDLKIESILLEWERRCHDPDPV